MENAIMVAAALISAGLVAGLAAIGASLGDAIVTSRFIEGLARQPEAKNTLISVGLIEALAIIAVVIALIMLYANPLIH